MTLVSDFVEKHGITRMDCEKIVALSVEGGSSHWCGHIRYVNGRRADRNGICGFYTPAWFEIKFCDVHHRPYLATYGEQLYQNLTETTLLEGIQRWVKWREANNKNINLDNLHEADADAIVQFAVFGEVVFPYFRF